jgi:cytoskeletal protein RodZ
MTESFNDTALPLHPTSPGALIKAAREKAGIHLAILAVNLKVSVKQLEALEADQFDKLPEPVFARALAAKVCRLIHIDANPVLALMPVATNGLKPLNLIDSEGQASFAGHALKRQHLGGRSKLWLLVACTVLLLLLAMNNDVSSTIFSFKVTPESAEVVPVMPPVQDPVAPEASQNDLPKAMVFESGSSNPNSPVQVSNEAAPTEVKK